MKTITLYGLQMLVGLVALAAGYAKLTGMGFVAEPLAMIGLGKTFLVVAGSVELVAGLCLLFPRSGMVGALLLTTVMVCTMGATVGHAVSQRGRRSGDGSDLPHLGAGRRDDPPRRRDQEEPRLGYLKVSLKTR